MRYMIMGAGALGSYFGARLAAHGEEVALIARGAHLKAMQNIGLRVLSPMGDLDLSRVAAYANPAEAGPADVVLLMVKNYDVESAGAAIAPLLGAEAIVVTVQNGVSAHRRLAAILGAGHVVPGMVYMPADIVEPGVVRHTSDFSRLVVGPLMDGRAGPVASALAPLDAAGVSVRQVADAEPALWEKFALLAPMSSMTCLTRLDIGPIRDCPSTLRLLRQALDETMAVGQAACPALDVAAGERAWDLLKSLRPNVHASMLDDLTRGKRLELDYLSGEIVRLGKLHGIATPFHAMAADLLKPFAGGAPD